MKKLKSGSWIFTIGLSGISLIYLFFFFLPGQRTVDDLRQEITQKQQTITKAYSMRQVIKDTQQEVEKTIAYVDRWINDAPSSGDLSATFGTIHRLAKLAGVSIKTFEPGTVKQLATMRKVPLKITVTGKFPETSRFLVDLEKMGTTIWFENCEITPVKKDGKNIQCELNLVIFADNDGNSD